MRDNAGYVKKAMDHLGVAIVWAVMLIRNSLCYREEGELSQRSVCDAVASGRKIVMHFKHSLHAYTLLEDIPVELQNDSKTQSKKRSINEVEQ